MYALGFCELVKEVEVCKAIMAQEGICYKTDITNVCG